MYSPIETYGQQLMRAPDQAEYRLPCLVEDEHGIRLLLTTDSTSIQTWTAAHAGGAQGLVRINRSGFAFTTVEHFNTQRTENRFSQAYELADHHWLRVDQWGMDFVALLQLWNERFASTEDPFAQLHTHTEFSAWDGYQTMDELGQRMTELGQRHVAITDHNGCFGHPDAHRMGEDYGLHVIYGMETYFVDDRFDRERGQFDYWHLVMIAQDEEGLHNLWAASTEAHRDGTHGKAASLDWDTLTRLNSGLLVTTACLGGPLAEPYLKDDEQRALTNLARLGDVFGDRLSIELHTTQLADQMKVNRWLVDVSAKTGVPLVAAVDAHYARREQKFDHKVWMAVQTGGDVNKDTELFAGEGGYHLHSIHEVREALNYLPGDVVEKAITKTTSIAESCTAEIKRKIAAPVYSRPTPEHPDPAQHDIERFVDMTLEKLVERIPKGADPAPYFAKWEYETPLEISKKQAGYFLICAEFVNWAKQQGILVGPGRGSGVASVNAWSLRITELDPVRGNLLIDRFITPGRKGLPDFDLDFPRSRQDEVVGHVQERWGHTHVVRVGSHIRLKNKGVFKSVQRAIQSELPGESFQWVVAINRLIDQAEASTAGLGLSWDALMDEVGELMHPFREKMPELFRLAKEFHLRLNAYGKHAAGFIIDPDNDLEAELPMRLGDDKGDGTTPMVTQWAMEDLEYVGKVKFDLLTLRNLDTVQGTIDTIREETGRVINPYDWEEEYLDPEVAQELADGWTLGVFQVETPLGKRITRQLKPHDRDDLTNIVTICRPGPLRSGLDKLYMRRRDGIEQITVPDPRLMEVLKDTYGVMLYQEDIMNICKVIGGYTPDEADDVRKILGKKKVELVAAEGVKFVERAVANSTDRQVALDLWTQMAEFAKYSFNRAHGYAYGTISWWTGWFKVHWPRQSLTNLMATIDKERIPAFVSEARRLGYQVLPPDINISKNGFSAEGIQIRYGLQSLSGIAGASAGPIIAGQPYTSYDDFIERAIYKGSPCNMGTVKKLVSIGAFDSLHPNRRALEASVLHVTSGDSDRCKLWDPEFRNEHNDLPCHFDWNSEPKNYGRPNPKTGERKLLKAQPKIPTTCRRKACRQYIEKEPESFDHLPNYTEEEIREREVQQLGVYLSSSPFDIVPDEIKADFFTADDLSVVENGIYAVMATVLSTRPDPKGRDFGFCSLLTPSGELSAIMWRQDWERLRPAMNRGTLAFCRIIKTNDDWYRLDEFSVLR